MADACRHGRDHKLRVWKFGMKDEGFLDKVLPVDVKEGETTQNQPWMLHSLPVNALNFCAFDMIFLDSLRSVDDEKQGSEEEPSLETQSSQDRASQPPVLFAVPNALNSGAIDIFHLPLERRVSTIPADPATSTGMVMAVRLLLSSGELYAASAYEDGQVMVFVRRGRLTAQGVSSSASGKGIAWKWEKLYASKPHTQPVLSIDVAPSKDYFFSSSADSVLVKHPIPDSSLVAVAHAEGKVLKTTSTKHAGQQSLRIRSDGKIFATAGWDARTRVYSCKTMKELAVLKWHRDGCYAVAFAEIFGDSTAVNDSPTDAESKPGDEKETQLMRRSEGSLAIVQQQRNQKAQKTHWLAVGSKDGKISLWDIY